MLSMYVKSTGFLVIFILVSVLTFGQKDTIRFTIGEYELTGIGAKINQKETGDWEYYFTNNQMQSRGRYDNGVTIGFWQNWYENGQKQTEGSYLNGDKHGVWETWEMDGRFVRSVTYKKGKKHGSTVEYDLDVGYEVAKVNFRADSLHGKAVWLSLEGDKKIEGKFDFGARVGRWIWYYPNGKIKAIEHFLSGKMNGVFIWYDESGQELERAKFKNGVKLD